MVSNPLSGTCRRVSLLGARPKARVTGEGSAPSGDAPRGATRVSDLNRRFTDSPDSRIRGFAMRDSTIRRSGIRRLVISDSRFSAGPPAGLQFERLLDEQRQAVDVDGFLHMFRVEVQRLAEDDLIGVAR